ncbi:MAG: hypothetical protein QOD66_175 [Solirubrobacteraceae bacterium]|nr:hypothetical protein [Solirubrobacteraceae bacterium]
MPQGRRKTQPTVSFNGDPPFDAGVAALAAVQNAVFGVAQLTGLGLTAAGVRKRAASGRLHRIHRGVYSLVPEPLLTRDGRYMAAVLAAGDGAVLSHKSAAALLGLRADNRATIDVTVRTDSTRRRSGVTIHCSRTLTDADVTTVNGIPCTSVARTILDLASCVNRRAVERTLDQAEVEGVLNLDAVKDQLERNTTRAGAKTLNAVLHEHVAGSTFTWNDFEERFLALVRSAHLPAPEVNAWVDLDDGEPAIRVDFLWRDRRAVIETDGHRTHRTRQAAERDRRNDQRLTLAGWGHLRLTWLQLTREPERITATAKKLLGYG